jgi:crotonobetainyl-CoA:carnitine CoA-transferase CaiB-like acyl-CoA transferase
MRIIEISRSVAGAYAGDLLCLAGAEVHRLAPPPVDAANDEEAFALELLNTAKAQPSLRLDAADDREAVLSLIASADALIEDLGPGGLEALGLSEDELRARQPRLIITRLSDFGQTGPHAGWAASELVNLAAGGLLYVTGTWERPPVQLAPFQAQVTAAVFAAIGTMAALHAGEPVTIDLSKQEAVASMITPAITEYVYRGTIPAREGKVGTMTRIEQASDDWFYAGPANPPTADYQLFSAFLGVPELADPKFATPDSRAENWEEHQRLIQPRLRERTAKEWIDDAAEWRLTFGVLQSTLDLLDSPVLDERQFFRTVDLPSGTVRAPAAPYLVDNERPQRNETPAEPT